MAKFHLLKDLYLHAAIVCQFTTSGLAQPFGQSYIIEHNVSTIQLPLKHNSYISRNCWDSIIQEDLGIIPQGLMCSQLVPVLRAVV